jgi:predicted nuclease of predicted toxin-antitoxin system
MIMLTKDADFPEMVERLGPPAQVIWLTCGNTSNSALRVLLANALPRASFRFLPQKATKETKAEGNGAGF